MCHCSLTVPPCSCDCVCFCVCESRSELDKSKVNCCQTSLQAMAVWSRQEPWSAPIREGAEPSSSCRAAHAHTHTTLLTTQTYVTINVESTMGELRNRGSDTLSLGHELSSGWVYRKGALLTVGFWQKWWGAHTHTHTQGKVEPYPLCVARQELARWTLSLSLSLCIGTQMTDGTQVPLGRQTTTSLGRASGKWWMLPSSSHIWNEIRAGKEDGSCYWGCSGGHLCFFILELNLQAMIMSINVAKVRGYI